MRKMCDEIVCIENIVDLQATYSVLDLNISNLITSIIRESKKGFIGILDVRIFLHSLKDIPFQDELRAHQLRSELSKCIKHNLYIKSKKWVISEILKNIREIRNLIQRDYRIEGSLIIYNNEEIQWDLEIKFIHN